MKQLVFILLLIPVFAQAQLDQSNFSILKNEKVISDNKIEWTQFGPGNAGFVNFLRYHPEYPDLCFTSPDMGNAYQTEDNGQSWYTVKDFDGTGLYMRRIADLYYSSITPSFGLAIEGSRFFKTNDTGKNWEYITHCPWYDNDANGYDKKGWYYKVSALALDPGNDDVWYVGAGAHPRGQSHLAWYSFTNANAENPRGKENFHYGTAFQGKIWRTNDAGQSWTELSAGIDPKAQFSRIIVHPENSNIVFAASSHGLYKSSDQGATWSDIGASQLDNNTIMDMDAYYNASTGEFVLYVIDQVRYHPDGSTTRNTGGIFKSEDNGDSWISINSNLELDINRLTGGVPDNYYNYIANWFGISVSEAKTNYFNLPNDAVQYFNSLNVDPSDKNTLYVGFYDAQVAYSFTPGRLWKTSDRGDSWINVARDFGPAWENDKAFWSERNNPYSDNMEEGHLISNQQWGNDYPLRSLRYCAVNSRGDVMIIYAHNTFLSTDKGETWNQVDEVYTGNGNIIGTGNSNLPGAEVFQDKRLGEGITYFGTGEHKLWRSTNDAPGDVPAVEFFDNAEQTVWCLSTHPYGKDTVFTTSMRQHNMDKIMRSTDAGQTFEVWGQATDAEEYMRTQSLLIDPLNPDYMYLGVNVLNGKDSNKEGGVFFSSDGGKNFSRRNAGLPSMPLVIDIEFDPRDHTNQSLFAAAQYNKEQGNINGGLYFTSDRGNSWNKVNTPSVVEGVNSVTFDHTGRLYITAGRRHWDTNHVFNAGGAWYSDDYGTTWTRIFQIEDAKLFDVSPFDHNILVLEAYDGSRNPGVYLSEDRGQTWTKNNRIIGQPDKITDLEFDVYDETRLHLTVQGSGFFKGVYADGANARKIMLSPGFDHVNVEGTLQLEPQLEEGFSSDIVYRSSNPEIATVNASGLVTGIKVGAVNIYATSADGRYSDYLQLVVRKKSDVAIKDAKETFFKVYPNPVRNNTLNIESEKEGQVALYNLQGKLKSILRLKYGFNSFDLSGLNPGNYLLKALNRESGDAEKIIIP